MRMVRDRADARWLPSRFRFALFRVAALLMMSRSTSREQRGLVLVIDRDQTAAEQYLLSAGAVVTGTCFMAAALQRVIGTTGSVVLCLPLTLAMYSALLVGAGLVIQPLVTMAGAPLLLARRLNGFTHMAVLLGTALFFASQPSSWVRPISMIFLAVVASNAVASVVMLAFRSREIALERRFGVER